MKSKKKLLLMGVGVMGALAMGVGATSTFAWYQAAIGAKPASSDGFGSITTANTCATVSDVEIPVQITPTFTLGDTGALELARASAAGVLSTGHVDANSKYHDDGTSAVGEHNVLFGILKVNIQALASYTDGNGTTWDKDQAAAALGGDSVVITFSGATFTRCGASEKAASATVYYSKAGNVYSVVDSSSFVVGTTDVSSYYKKTADTSRARFFKDSAVEPNYASSSAITVTDVPANCDTAGTSVNYTVALTEAGLKGDGDEFYVGFYVYGGDQGNSATNDGVGGTADAVEAGVKINVVHS